MKKTKRFNWPLRVVTSSSMEKEQAENKDAFFEGTFVAMLLNKVPVVFFLNNYFSLLFSNFVLFI